MIWSGQLDLLPWTGREMSSSLRSVRYGVKTQCGSLSRSIGMYWMRHQGRLSPLTPWSKFSPPLPSPPLPSPSPPLRSRPPLLRLGIWGSALAPPAGPSGARPPNGIFGKFQAKNIASSNDLQELFRKWNIKLWFLICREINHTVFVGT